MKWVSKHEIFSLLASRERNCWWGGNDYEGTKIWYLSHVHRLWLVRLFLVGMSLWGIRLWLATTVKFKTTSRSTITLCWKTIFFVVRAWFINVYNPRSAVHADEYRIRLLVREQPLEPTVRLFAGWRLAAIPSLEQVLLSTRMSQTMPWWLGCQLA